MDDVEEIKSRLSIEDVIGEYIQLKRSGRNWRGLSPFTNESTPSFMVSPDKQIWHDFSSGKGGNIFSFVMEIEGLDFKGALELLAKKANVDLKRYGSGNSKIVRTIDKERLYAVLALAAKFYQVHFSRNQTALEYILTKRNFTKESALKWQIGYSPRSGEALMTFLKRKNFNDNEIQQAGLSTKSYNHGSIDMFRGRIMLPLADQQGRIIGFTARLIDDQPNAPKYINTPQTILYDKSRHIYGLHLAKDAIRKNKYVVLVEGNLDVIASHQIGVSQVVATAGTALTQQNLKALARFSDDIRLSFDADRAGQTATERAIPIASKVGVALSVISIPSGKDPDELIKQDPSKWQEAIDNPQYALDWLVDRYTDQLDLSSASGKKQFSDVILKVVRGLEDKVEQEHYINQLSGLLGVSKEALLSKLSRRDASEKQFKRLVKIKKTDIIDSPRLEQQKVEDHFLALVLLHPKLRDFLSLVDPTMLVGTDSVRLLNFLKTNGDFSLEQADTELLQPFADYVKILQLQYEALYQDLDLTELRYEVGRLQARIIVQYIQNQKKILSTQLKSANESDTNNLLTRVKELDALLNKVKVT